MQNKKHRRRRRRRAQRGLLTRRQALPFLRKHGLPIGESTFDRLCSPKGNAGPPVAGIWNGIHHYTPEGLLTWGENRLRGRGERAA